ncbi:MAG TPA: hypothetical protein VMH79_01465 [Thermoanaerobaculia bacterium]|nr:hypothetical protein [Thermoanaerobaculia bacterium]
MKRLPVRAARLAAPLIAAIGALFPAADRAPAATFVVSIGRNGTSFVDQTSGNGTTTIHVGDTAAGIRDSTRPATATTPSPPSGASTTTAASNLSMMQGMIVVQAAGNPPSASFRSSPTKPVAG